MKKKNKPSYQEVYKKSKCKHLDIVDQKQAWGHKLGISWDYETDPNQKDKWMAIFLSIHNKEEHDHKHMIMNHKQARNLRDWLNNFLKEVDTYKKNKAKKKAEAKSNAKYENNPKIKLRKGGKDLLGPEYEKYAKNPKAKKSSK